MTQITHATSRRKRPLPLSPETTDTKDCEKASASPIEEAAGNTRQRLAVLKDRIEYLQSRLQPVSLKTPDGDKLGEPATGNQSQLETTFEELTAQIEDCLYVVNLTIDNLRI